MRVLGFRVQGLGLPKTGPKLGAPASGGLGFRV